MCLQIGQDCISAAGSMRNGLVRAATTLPRGDRLALVSAPARTATSAAAESPAQAHGRYERAFAGLEAPFAFVDLDAMWSNAADMLRRACGKPIRVASKSLRCRALQERILARDAGFRGLLTYTLPETLWLAEEGFEDLMVAYPTTDREALAELAALTQRRPHDAPVAMVDSPQHLDLIEAAGGGRAPVRVAIEIDVSYWIAGGRLKVGAKRSPVRTAAAAVALAREIERRPGVRLVGLMAYEAQIAGVGNRVPGKRLRSAAITAMQRASAREIRARRAEIVAAVSAAVAGISELEFVNGGGTGSIDSTASEQAVTEVAAGSGFYAPTLFDNYSAFRLRPAAMFALPVVRKPSARIATALGGGYLASGAGDRSRLPTPYLPEGLRLDPQEGAGEVQTPLLGPPAAALGHGDRVYFRHTKAGEFCERFASLYLVSGAEIVDEVPTYRGEGRCFI
jgi:D-serine deaminase-like pyridoxal phosphate-dependent protein